MKTTTQNTQKELKNINFLILLFYLISFISLYLSFLSQAFLSLFQEIQILAFRDSSISFYSLFYWLYGGSSDSFCDSGQILFHYKSSSKNTKRDEKTGKPYFWKKRYPENEAGNAEGVCKNQQNLP